jgi:hypothetical protein
MTKLLEGSQVEQEIRDVIRSGQARGKVVGHCRVISPIVTCEEDNSVVRSDASPEAVIKGLLLRWSQAVCSSYGLSVTDFTDSFADGRALCYLINYYHPSLVRIEDIGRTSDDCDKQIGGTLTEATALQNERRNWRKAVVAIQELGGVPCVVPFCDSQSPPEERSTLLCLSYLCSRLMESSKEIFATILIQAYYRKYQRKVVMEKKIKSAKQIFSFWMEHKQNYYQAQRLKYAFAVSVLEGFVLSHKSALRRLQHSRLEKERKISAAISIQVR